jgi:DNA-binding MarR family transcriptional regulator
MHRREYAIGGVVLVFITLATLWSSIEYHYMLSKEYGGVSNLFLPVVAISSFVLGFFVSIFFQWGVNVIQFENVVKLLPVDDKKVLTILFNRRRMTQLELYAEADLSRTKISRVLSRLEDRGIITKKHLDNTNLIESTVYRAHPSTRLLTMLPGFSETRLILVIFIILLFGILLAIISDLHIITLEKPFRGVMYLNVIEVFTLGCLFSLVLRRRMSQIQLEKILDILPPDEKVVLSAIYQKHYLTQKSIVEETRIHQMKISRILQKFEQRGVIKKRPYGYTNMIVSQI